jgi:predicted RNA methylase
MAKEKQLSNDALAVLTECEVDGNLVRICGGQLDRKLYQEVDLALRGIGGKWDKRTRGHVFAEPTDEIKEMLEGCVQTGVAVPLRRNGFFPTPLAVGRLLVELADIKALKVLEPSAGVGNIVEAIAESNPASIDAIENDPKLYQQLIRKYDAPWFHPYPMNFFDWVPGPIYDRAVMNPPFGGLADIDHVLHAFSLLKPGGKLVSVMSSSVTFRREKKAIAFRALVADAGQFKELPEGAFKESGTMVRTIVCVLDKGPQ